MGMTATEAREHFSSIVNRVSVSHERVVITRAGKAVVAVVPIEELELLERLEDEADSLLAEAAISDPRNARPVSLDEARAQLEL